MYMLNWFVSIEEAPEKTTGSLVVSSGLEKKDICRYVVKDVSNDSDNKSDIKTGDYVYCLSDFVMTINRQLKIVNINYIVCREER